MADCFVVLGDSHWAGRCTHNQTFTGSGGHTATMRVSGSWVTVADPTNYFGISVGQGSYWPVVMTALVAAAGADLRLINVAIGGTGLVNPITDNWPKGDTLYSNVVSAITESGDTTSRKIFLLSVGANDTDSYEPTYAEYLAALNQLATDLKADYPEGGGAVCLLVQMGSFTSVSPTRAALDHIRQAQNDCVWGPSGILYDLVPDGSNVHYLSDAFAATIGQRVSAAIVAQLYGGAAWSGGPVIRDAIYGADRTQIRARFHTASALQPTSGLAGFRAVDNGTPVAPSAVTATNDLVILSFSSALSATGVTLDLGSGNDGEGAAVPTDAAGLPARAFVGQALGPFLPSLGWIAA